MKNTLLLFLLILIIGCTKSNDDTTTEPTSYYRLVKEQNVNPDGSVNYTDEYLYDSNNSFRLSKIVLNSIFNGVRSQHFGYNSDNNINTITWGSGDLIEFRYQNGLIKERVVNTNIQSIYSYNSNNQLVLDNEGGCSQSHYTYNNNGNVSSYEYDCGGGVQNYLYDTNPTPFKGSFPEAYYKVYTRSNNNRNGIPDLNGGSGFEIIEFRYNDKNYPTEVIIRGEVSTKYTYETFTD